MEAAGTASLLPSPSGPSSRRTNYSQKEKSKLILKTNLLKPPLRVAALLTRLTPLQEAPEGAGAEVEEGALAEVGAQAEAQIEAQVEVGVVVTVEGSEAAAAQVAAPIGDPVMVAPVEVGLSSEAGTKVAMGILIRIIIFNPPPQPMDAKQIVSNPLALQDGILEIWVEIYPDLEVPTNPQKPNNRINRRMYRWNWRDRSQTCPPHNLPR